MTIHKIMKEMRDVPANKLEELYQVVRAFNTKAKRNAARRKKIMSFAGAFKDMSEKEFQAFQTDTKRVRSGMFNRKFDL